MASICIAEDDADIRNLLVFALQERGHEVRAVGDGQAALDAMVDDPPDALILDIMMPEMDGFRLLDSLVAFGVPRSTKVLVLTAKSSEKDRFRGLQHGADLYLTKPFHHDDFMSALDHLLGSSSEELDAVREKEQEKARLLVQLERAFPDF